MAKLDHGTQEYATPVSVTDRIIDGLAALTLLRDEGFRRDWSNLHAGCPWATSFQGRDFVTVWYRVYGDYYDPIIIRRDDGSGTLTGLLTLAQERKTGDLVVAGAHQAEYHAWLATPGEGDNFISEVLALLRRNYPRNTLTFKFLPPGTPTGWLGDASPWRSLALQRRHKRPLLAFGDGKAIAASLKKKSNKSRLNRLKRLGDLDFREIHTPSEFDAIIDQITDQYDLRQGAVNGSVPFGDDSLKKIFLGELMQCPGALHVSALTLDGVPVAAVVASREKDTVSVGVFSHSPFHAKHSPGKFHLLFLAGLLADQGFTSLDLTPGGQWKDRFATTSDEVAEVTVHFSSGAARRARTIIALEAIASRLCKSIGIRTEVMRSVPAKLKRFSATRALTYLRGWLWETREFRVYAQDAAGLSSSDTAPTMNMNNLRDLLMFTPWESWQSRDHFLSQALHRLESGDQVHTVSKNGQLMHYGWIADHVKKSYFSEVGENYVYPPGSAVLYDFATNPAARGQGHYQRSLRQMSEMAARCDGIEKIYISVLANNGPSRHVIEKTGFNCIARLCRTVRFGIQHRSSR